MWGLCGRLALDPRPPSRLPPARPQRAATARRLAQPLRPPARPAGNLLRNPALPRHLLAGCQLAPRRPNPGPRQTRHAQPIRPARQRHLRQTSLSRLESDPQSLNPLNRQPSLTPRSNAYFQSMFSTIARAARVLGTSSMSWARWRIPRFLDSKCAQNSSGTCVGEWGVLYGRKAKNGRSRFSSMNSSARFVTSSMMKPSPLTSSPLWSSS